MSDLQATEHDEDRRTIPAEPLGPDSLLWHTGLPRTSALVGGAALLMQVAHPTIGGAVRDHSRYRTDPWGRLESTLRSVDLFTFGGPAALEEAARLREFHKQIKGTDDNGKRYSGTSPSAGGWVQMTNAHAAIQHQRLFGTPFTSAEQDRAVSEQHQIGLLLGVRPQDMPTTATGLRAYLDDMIATTLTNNSTVRDLLDSLSLESVPPPVKLFPAALWAALRPLGHTVLMDVTVGALPPAARELFGLTWTNRDRRRLRAVALAVRTATPFVPDRLLHYPLGYEARRAAHRLSRSTA